MTEHELPLRGGLPIRVGRPRLDAVDENVRRSTQQDNGVEAVIEAALVRDFPDIPVTRILLMIRRLGKRAIAGRTAMAERGCSSLRVVWPTDSAMANLRQPISASRAAIIVVAGAALIVSQRWLGELHSPLAWVVLVAVGEFGIQPMSTLAHELGHAAAVAVLGRRRAVAIVGRGPWITLKLGRVSARLSVLPTRGVRIAGVCRYDPSGMAWRRLAWVALAGPMATGLELVLVLGFAPMLWNAGTFVHYLLVFSALGLLNSLFSNLLPRRAGEGDRTATVTQRDGWHARHAFARHRAGAAPPQAPAASGARPSREHEIELPPHWAPADPDRRRVFEDELRRALRPAAPHDDPNERRRLEAQLGAAVTPPAVE